MQRGRDDENDGSTWRVRLDKSQAPTSFHVSHRRVLQGKHVEGANHHAVKLKSTRKYRQYMNRKGAVFAPGFSDFFACRWFQSAAVCQSLSALLAGNAWRRRRNPLLLGRCCSSPEASALIVVRYSSVVAVERVLAVCWCCACACCSPCARFIVSRCCGHLIDLGLANQRIVQHFARLTIPPRLKRMHVKPIALPGPTSAR